MADLCTFRRSGRPDGSFWIKASSMTSSASGSFSWGSGGGSSVGLSNIFLGSSYWGSGGSFSTGSSGIFSGASFSGVGSTISDSIVNSDISRSNSDGDASSSIFSGVNFVGSSAGTSSALSGLAVLSLWDVISILFLGGASFSNYC